MKSNRSKSKVYFVLTRGLKESEFHKKVIKLIEVSGILEGITCSDYVGIKLHLGEENNKGFVKPGLLRDIALLCKNRSKNVAVIETNTIYVGARSNTISHLNLAYSHGYTYENIGVPIIILDGVTGRDFVNIRVNKKHLKEVKLASGIADFEFILGIAHVTSHCQTGLAGCIKNLGMGCASRAGKLQQHSTVLPQVTLDKCIGCSLCIKWCPVGAISLEDKKASISIQKCIGCGECTVACRVGAIEIKWNESARNLQEKMAEYAYGVLMERKGGFLNFLMRITKDCDCMAKDTDSTIVPDIGVLASMDPVAIDKATQDLLINETKCDRLKGGYPNIDWSVQIKYASEIGLGNLDYQLIRVE